MANFEILNQNNLNTTTMISAANGTSTFDALFDRKSSAQYASVGRNNDATGHTITIEFPSSRNLSRICIQNTNLKSFKVYHSSNSANTFTLTSTSDTTTSDWTGNAATSLYLMFGTVACTSVIIDGTTTIDANEEKKIGQLWCCDKSYSFDRNPDAKGYRPKMDRKEYVHEMAGGGWSSYIIDEYFKAEIRLNYWSVSESSELNDIYNTRVPFVFVPWPTGSSWYSYQYEEIYECIWVKDYEFRQPAANNFLDVGFKGRIRMQETAR